MSGFVSGISIALNICVLFSILGTVPEMKGKIPSSATSTSDTGGMSSNIFDTYQTTDKINLDIEDMTDPADCPKDTGWCGEDSIKMAAAYFGAYIPQKYINKIANPVHPDLYSNDIPVSLQKLNLVADFPDTSLDIFQFKDWIKDSLIKSKPVLLGVKIKGSKNTLWSLDHFVLATGFDGNNIIFNSNNYGLGKMSGTLTDKSEPLTLVNSFNKYYGIAIRGFNFADNSLPIKLKIVNEYPDSNLVEVNITCSHLDDYKSYTIIKYKAAQDTPYLSLDNMASKRILTLSGKKSSSFTDVIDINEITVYRCYLSE